MFSDPHRTWDKTRPFVLSVGGHVLLLALLYVSFLRESQPPPGRAGASAVEATLVSASLQAEIDQAESPPPPQPPLQPEPPSVTSPAPSEKPADVRPDAVQRAPKQVGARHQPQESDAVPKPALIEPPSQPQQDVANSPGVAQEEPDASDPYAEMRRQRAEAERRHQLEEQAITQAAARAQNAQANGQPTAGAPAQQMVGHGGMDQLLGVLPDHSGNLFAMDGYPTADDVLRPQRCQPAAFQQRGGNAITTDWIECLFDTAVPDPANVALRTMGLPYGGFD